MAKSCTLVRLDTFCPVVPGNWSHGKISICSVLPRGRLDKARVALYNQSRCHSSIQHKTKQAMCASKAETECKGKVDPMTTPQDRTKERADQHLFVARSRGERELARLTIQDRMITQAMGGPLPEQADLTTWRGCWTWGSGSGSGPRSRPEVSQPLVIGIDISNHTGRLCP